MGRLEETLCAHQRICSQLGGPAQRAGGGPQPVPLTGLVRRRNQRACDFVVWAERSRR
jgi:hypothetical protein